LTKKLSNPKELIHYSCTLASNLFLLGFLEITSKKQIFQNTLFPKGLAYDSKIDNYRTPVVNSVIVCIADLAGDLKKK